MHYSTMQGHDLEDFELRFGVRDVTDNLNFEYKSKIKQIKKHPDYNEKNLNHDIVLVKLEDPVDITNAFVYPADLPCGR